MPPCYQRTLTSGNNIVRQVSTLIGFVLARKYVVIWNYGLTLLNPNQSNRRPAVLWYFPLRTVFSSVTRFCEISPFWQYFKVLGDYVRAYFVLGKNLNLFRSAIYAIGQIFIAANGLILTNNLAIWAHWCSPLLPHSNFAKNWIRAFSMQIFLQIFGQVVKKASPDVSKVDKQLLTELEIRVVLRDRALVRRIHRSLRKCLVEHI